VEDLDDPVGPTRQQVGLGEAEDRHADAPDQGQHRQPGRRTGPEAQGNRHPEVHDQEQTDRDVDDHQGIGIPGPEQHAEGDLDDRDHPGHNPSQENGSHALTSWICMDSIAKFE
jgi:hypothetical protein